MSGICKGDVEEVLEKFQVDIRKMFLMCMGDNKILSGRCQKCDRNISVSCQGESFRFFC